ncbi:enoyl-CoA hydratase [Paenibacillus rhizovicinus]|uniref:Enoyl-CoA hydratase n=1 Tax=Paenibacillus rhizovicinus TaxID=2704463 RepID=A0A6C0P925_9BACL|nr:enoyl-CoA hydratase-related protein [Paenibacillus rhizovicinus]QHW34891.1 enoyl-CoA hydratase [Paenibacillus rhizovicinus]
MAEKLVQWKRQGHIGRIRLSRPESMNALNGAMLDELRAIIDETRNNTRGIRVVIIEGEGRAFSAGADLKERLANGELNQIRQSLSRIKAVFAALERLPQPTIAAINGYAFGGGLELALACDFRYAVRGAMLGLTEAGLGIIPGAGGTQRLPRLIGPARAKELILTARRITADQALEWGIVNGVADDLGHLSDMCTMLADEILANAPLAVYQAKAAIHAGMDADLTTALTIETEAYELLLPTKDRLEALEAFREKRPPRFKGE